MAAPKPRRRIVPQMLASPSSERPIEFGDVGGAAAAGTAPPEVQQDQQAQAEWARENLGLDRKVFLDLTTADNKEVDWRKVRLREGGAQEVITVAPPSAATRLSLRHPLSHTCALALPQILKERGVQKPGKAAAKQTGDGEGDDPLLLRVGQRCRRSQLAAPQCCDCPVAVGLSLMLLGGRQRRALLIFMPLKHSQYVLRFEHCFVCGQPPVCLSACRGGLVGRIPAGLECWPSSRPPTA